MARLSLNQPVRIFVDSNRDTADNLHQEFIRIRPTKENEREAIITGTIILVINDVITLVVTS